MRILDWIENTREEPEGRRKRTAFFLALACMAVVIFFWLVVEIIPSRFLSGGSGENTGVSGKGPVSVIGDMIGDTVNRIKEVKF